MHFYQDNLHRSEHPSIRVIHIFSCIFSRTLSHINSFFSAVIDELIFLLCQMNIKVVFIKIHLGAWSWPLETVCPWIRSSTECQTAIVSIQMHLNAMRLKHFWSDRIKNGIHSNTNTIPYSIMLENLYKGHFRIVPFFVPIHPFFHVALIHMHIALTHTKKNGRHSRFGSFTMENEHWILEVLLEALKVKCTLARAHTHIPGRQKRWSATERIIAFQIINAGYFYFYRSINFKNDTKNERIPKLYFIALICFHFGGFSFENFHVKPTILQNGYLILFFTPQAIRFEKRKPQLFFSLLLVDGDFFFSRVHSAIECGFIITVLIFGIPCSATLFRNNIGNEYTAVMRIVCRWSKNCIDL